MPSHKKKSRNPGRQSIKTSPRQVVCREASLEHSDVTRLARLTALLSEALCRNLGKDQSAGPSLRFIG